MMVQLSNVIGRGLNFIMEYNRFIGDPVCAKVKLVFLSIQQKPCKKSGYSE